MFWVVANALLARRYLPNLPRVRYTSFGAVEPAVGRSSKGVSPWPALGAGLPKRTQYWLVVGHMVGLNALAVALSATFQLRSKQLPLPVPGSTATPPFLSAWLADTLLLAGWAGATLSMQARGGCMWPPIRR